MDFKEICNLWPTARELSEDMGVPLPTVNNWKARNRVPAKYWRRMLIKADHRHIDVTTEDFIDAAEIAYE